MNNNTSNPWNQSGNQFRPTSSGNEVGLLPPVVYKIKSSMTGGWWFEAERKKFTFPFKVYGNHDHIVDRAVKTWDNTEENLGILLNGIKGTGKTVTAKQIANTISERYNMPVIILEGYNGLIPVAMESLNQDALFFFDEFEKKFPVNDQTPSSQQMMLSLMSGLSKSTNRSMFLLTSNNKALDENMINRPGRIRYVYEFGDLSRDAVQEIADDLLRPELNHLKEEIVNEATLLDGITIDSVKTMIQEANIYEEPPSDSFRYLNLTKKMATSFSATLVNGETFAPERELGRISLHEWNRTARYRSENYRPQPDRSERMYIAGESSGDVHFHGAHPSERNVYLVAIPISLKETDIYNDLSETAMGRELLVEFRKGTHCPLDRPVFFVPVGGAHPEFVESYKRNISVALGDDEEAAKNARKALISILQSMFYEKCINGYDRFDERSNDNYKVSCVKITPAFDKQSDKTAMSNLGFNAV